MKKIPTFFKVCFPSLIVLHLILISFFIPEMAQKFLKKKPSAPSKTLKRRQPPSQTATAARPNAPKRPTNKQGIKSRQVTKVSSKYK